MVIKDDRGSRKHEEVDKALGEENNLFKKAPCHPVLPWKTKNSSQLHCVPFCGHVPVYF